MFEDVIRTEATLVSIVAYSAFDSLWQSSRVNITILRIIISLILEEITVPGSTVSQCHLAGTVLSRYSHRHLVENPNNVTSMTCELVRFMLGPVYTKRNINAQSTLR